MTHDGMNVEASVTRNYIASLPCGRQESEHSELRRLVLRVREELERHDAGARCETLETHISIVLRHNSFRCGSASGVYPNVSGLHPTGGWVIKRLQVQFGRNRVVCDHEFVAALGEVFVGDTILIAHIAVADWLTNRVAKTSA